jgi:hypothetical protein
MPTPAKATLLLEEPRAVKGASSAGSATATGAFAADRGDNLSSLTQNCGGSWLAAEAEIGPEEKRLRLRGRRLNFVPSP